MSNLVIRKSATTLPLLESERNKSLIHCDLLFRFTETCSQEHNYTIDLNKVPEDHIDYSIAIIKCAQILLLSSKNVTETEKACSGSISCIIENSSLNLRQTYLNFVTTQATLSLSNSVP